MQCVCLTNKSILLLHPIHKIRLFDMFVFFNNICERLAAFSEFNIITVEQWKIKIVMQIGLSLEGAIELLLNRLENLYNDFISNPTELTPL